MEKCYLLYAVWRQKKSGILCLAGKRKEGKERIKAML
jgi:hypothetical protein